MPQIYALIKELADYEKAPDEVTNTIEQLEQDGFGERPLYGCLLAESDGKVVGMSFYYIRYSTWKGKILYLEDLVVKMEHRRGGVGSRLFEATMETARQMGMKGVSWQVLDWNEPAIEFYKKYHASFDHEWVNCRVVF